MAKVSPIRLIRAGGVELIKVPLIAFGDVEESEGTETSEWLERNVVEERNGQSHCIVHENSSLRDESFS